MDLWRIKSKAAKGYAFWVAEDINHMALDSSKPHAERVPAHPNTEVLTLLS